MSRVIVAAGIVPGLRRVIITALPVSATTEASQPAVTIESPRPPARRNLESSTPGMAALRAGGSHGNGDGIRKRQLYLTTAGHGPRVLK